MKKINSFNSYPSPWSYDEWQYNCPEMTYRVLESAEFPDWLPSNLTNKFNSAVIAASGDNSTYVAAIIGFRIDGDEIDEHPYFVAFDKYHPDKQYSGFIDHGHWDGRTTPIPEEMLKMMESSGITVNFQFNRKPVNTSGDIEELREQDIISGFEKVYYIAKGKE